MVSPRLIDDISGEKSFRATSPG